MDIVKRVGGGYLILSGLAAMFLLMLTPVFHDGSDEYPAWKILNYFMAAGTIIMLVVNFLRRREQVAASAEVDAAYMRMSLVWYGTLALVALFWWEWLWTLNPESETGEAVTSHMVYFPLMDVLYLIIGMSTGLFLIRGR